MAGGPDAADLIDAAPLPPLPDDAEPCAQPTLWPDAVRSSRLPVIVHHRGDAEAAMADVVLALVEHAWDVEVGQLGFRPPPADDGTCGPDAALDVFLWRGKEECYVDVLGEIDATPHDDEPPYLVVDPWGRFGGALLATTVAHELNHAFQAADDWDDLPIAYEMTAAFVEDEVHDADDGYLTQVIDFQAHPDWSIDRDDGYETWFMYGAALYLRYLRDRHFGGDARWIGGVWRAMRSPLGSGEPDLEDALDELLAPRGTSFVASVPDFARWRYYTGARADGAHLEEAAAMAVRARRRRGRRAGRGGSDDARVDLRRPRATPGRPGRGAAPRRRRRRALGGAGGAGRHRRRRRARGRRRRGDRRRRGGAHAHRHRVAPGRRRSRRRSHQCSNPHFVDAAYIDPAHKLALLRVAYTGTDSCWEPASELHVVAW